VTVLKDIGILTGGTKHKNLRGETYPRYIWQLYCLLQ